MPDSILDLDAFNAEFGQQQQVAQERHDATGTGARLGANLKEGLWNLQASGAGLVGADQARAEALASQRLSQDLRGAAADTAGEQAIGAAIESSPMTLASFLPAAVLRIPAARIAAGRAMQAATARGLGAAEAQMLARMAGEKAANVAARAGMAGGMGALSAPDAYDQAKQAGASDGTALANAIGSAFTEGAFTYLSPGGVESAMLTRPALTGGLGRVLAQGGRRLAGAAAGETGEEVATEGAHILREQALGINNGTLFDPANLQRLGLSAAAGGLMGGGFTAPGVAADVGRQVPGAVAPAILAARLRLAQPEVAPPVDPAAPPAPMAPDGPGFADLTEQALAAEAVRRGLPQDFTPLPSAPQGPAGQGFAGYAEAQPDPVAALAQLWTSLPPQEQQAVAQALSAPEVPRAEAAPPAAPGLAPGPVPGAAPPAPGAGPAPAPIAPQPQAPAAPPVARLKNIPPSLAKALEGLPTPKPGDELRRKSRDLQRRAEAMMVGIPAGQPILSMRDRNRREKSAEMMFRAAELHRQAEQMDATSASVIQPKTAAAPAPSGQPAAAPAVPAAVPAAAPAVPVAAAPQDQPGTGFRPGQRVRWTKGKKAGEEATVETVRPDGRLVLRLTSGKTVGGNGGITPENLEPIADASPAPNAGAASVEAPRSGPAAPESTPAQPANPPAAQVIPAQGNFKSASPEAPDVRQPATLALATPTATAQPPMDAGRERVPRAADAPARPVDGGAAGAAPRQAEPAPAPVPPASQPDRAASVVPPSPVNTGENARTTGEKEPAAPVKPSERYADLLADPLASDIPLATAMRGHAGTSMVPEDRARGEIADYVQHLRSVRDYLNSIAKTPEQQAVADAEFSVYRTGYRQRRLEALSRRSRVMSSMVAGPSKFPAASNRKKSDAYEKSISEAVDWSERAQKAAIKAVRAAAPGGDPNAPVSSDDADAVTKLKGKIAQAEKLQSAMVAGNKVVRDKKLTDVQKVAKLIELGLSEANAREALKPDFTGRTGFPSYALTNNSANIRRMQDRVAELERKRSQSTRSVTVGDITATDDVDGNRLRLTFPGKPAPERLRALKAAGFKWSPKEGAWQRMRGDGAIAAAERALGIDLAELRQGQATAPESKPEPAPTAPEAPAAEAPKPTDAAPYRPSIDLSPDEADAEREAIRLYADKQPYAPLVPVERYKQRGQRIFDVNEAIPTDLGPAWWTDGKLLINTEAMTEGGKGPKAGMVEATAARLKKISTPASASVMASAEAANGPEVKVLGFDLDNMTPLGGDDAQVAYLDADGVPVRVMAAYLAIVEKHVRPDRYTSGRRGGIYAWRDGKPVALIMPVADKVNGKKQPIAAPINWLRWRSERGGVLGAERKAAKSSVQKLDPTELEKKLRKLTDPRPVLEITESLYRLVNAVGDPTAGNGEVVITRRSDDTGNEYRLHIEGPHGDADSAMTTDEALRESGIVLGAHGRFKFSELVPYLQEMVSAISGYNAKARIVNRANAGKEPAGFGDVQGKARGEVPDLPRQKAYSQRDEESRPAIVNLDAVNKDMQVGRVVAVPGGWRFVAPGGRGIGIRSATAEEARAHEGRAEGYFTGVDPLTGEPQIVLIPGRTGAFTVNHELVHHARRLGVLTDAHLEALGRIGAKHGIAAKWGKAYRDAKPDITAAELREEIAAKTVEAIKAGDIPLKPGFVQRFLDWVADLARAAVGLPKSERRLARDVVEGTIFAGGQEPAAAPVAGDQVFSLADDGEPEKRTPQERLEAARQGVKPGDKPTTDPTMLEEFRRHFRHLDPAKHAEAIAIIRELEARLDAATGQAERIILGHVDGLTREQAEAFNDRLVLEDVLRQIEAGEFDGGPTEDGRTAAQIGEDIQRDLAKAIERGGKPAAEAYAKRRAFQEQHTRALVDADLLAPEALDDPRYYHRQVLAHLGERQGMGLGGSDVRNRTRGFQRGRAGGTAADIPFYGDEEAQRDFNANYAQAEFEYLAQSVQELARADALERLEARYNQMRAAKAEAKARNRARMDELWVKENTVAETGERDEEAIAEGWDKHWRSMIAMNNARLAELAMEDDFGGPYADVWQDLADARRKWHGENDHLEPADRMPFTFDHPAWWKALSWLAAHQDVIVSMSDPKTGKTWEEKPAINALAIFKAVAGREEQIRETLGRDYQTWQDVAKDMPGMVLWQPEEGLQLVPGWAATDQAITNALRKAGVDDATVADALPPAAPVGQALKRGLIVMGKKPEWLIPEALAKQLNDMRRVPDLNALGRIAETWSRRWKLWMLHQPMRVLKYQLNNLVGDLDVALTQPAILREVARDRMQVARDLWAYTHGKAVDPKTETQMRRAQAMGLFDSGVSAAELPDVDKLPALRALFGQGWDKGWAGIPEAARRYFDSAQRFGRWREAIMRVSAARHFYREVSPSRRRYAASRKDELDQLYDRWQALSDQIDAIARRRSPSATDDAQVREAEAEIADLHATIAAKLARELLGDYGNLSHAGQKLRRFLIPFWSWAEINAPRYARLVRNARYEGGGGSGQALGASAAMAGGVAVRAAALSGMVFAWNAMMKAALGIGDDDDPNKEADMSKLMIILGKDGDGKVYGVRVAGALSDALGWLDLDNAWKHAKDLAIGYREGKLAQAGMDVAGDMLAAPANRIAQGLSPIIKVPIEQATRRQLFPNAFKPRPLGDRWGHLADAMGVGPAYRAATDRASIGNAAGGALLVTHDPSAAAANRVRQDAEGWAQRNGRTIKAGGGVPTEQREALGQAKGAHARGEEARAARWLRRYFELGGKPGYLGSSKAAMHPLSVILKEDRAAYLKSLDPARRADYDKAVRRWRELWEQDDGMTALAGRVWRETRRAAAAGDN